MPKIVNGSSLAPASGEPPKQIVLLLHGYGSNGADLISLAPHWQAALPDAVFLAPNAPLRLAMGGGYQWWPLTASAPRALAAGAAQAAPAIDAFIDRKLRQPNSLWQARRGSTGERSQRRFILTPSRRSGSFALAHSPALSRLITLPSTHRPPECWCR